MSVVLAPCVVIGGTWMVTETTAPEKHEHGTAGHAASQGTRPRVTFVTFPRRRRDLDTLDPAKGPRFLNCQFGKCRWGSGEKYYGIFRSKVDSLL